MSDEPIILLNMDDVADVLKMWFPNWVSGYDRWRDTRAIFAWAREKYGYNSAVAWIVPEQMDACGEFYMFYPYRKFAYWRDKIYFESAADMLLFKIEYQNA